MLLSLGVEKSKPNTTMSDNVSAEKGREIRAAIKSEGWRSTEQWHEDGSVTIRLETGEIVPEVGQVTKIIKAAKKLELERQKRTRRAIAAENRPT